MKKQLYFVPRNTWFYTTFSHISAYARYAITIAILLCLFLLWFFTAYRMLSKTQFNYALSLENLLEQKIKLQEDGNHIQELHRDLDAKKNSTKELINSSAQHTLELQDLLEVMQKSNLKLQAYTPQAELTQQWYAKKIVRLDCLGTYEQILLLLNYIATVKSPLVCSYIHMEKQHDNILASLHIVYYNFSKVLA